MKVTLKDGAPRHVGHVEINVSKNGNTVEIGATGVDPAPVVLEYYGGKLTLRLFGADGQPTVVQTINTTPTPVKAAPATDPAFPLAMTTAVVAVLPAAVAAASAPAADFDEAAFDAA